MAHMRNTTDSEVAAPGVGEAPDLSPLSSDERESSAAPAPMPLLRATEAWQQPFRRARRVRRPMAPALLLSLLIHGLLLSLTFGGDTLGLPGLVAPWQDRRGEVPDLRVVLLPAPVASAEPALKPVAAPSQQVTIVPPVAGRPAPTKRVPAALPPRVAEVVDPPEAKPTAPAAATQQPAAGAAPTQAPTPAKAPDRVVSAQIPEPAGIDVEPIGEPASVVLAAPRSPTSVTAAAPSASSPQTVPTASGDPDAAARQTEREEAARREEARAEAVRMEAERQEAARRAAAQQELQRQEAARVEAARQEAARQTVAQQEAQREAAAREEAARVEAARLEAERQNAARQTATQLELQRQEAARQEAAGAEATRQDATRQEAARQEAARQEAARQENARQEAARQEAARQEAQREQTARQEAARAEAARLEAARQAVARQEASRVEAEKDDAARREVVLRAIGRQLDEEAAQREAASTAERLPNPLPYSLSTARRVRLWGRSDPNVELVRYAEAWARKIQFNTAVDTVRELAQRPHSPPMLSVAVRSDGSVESVTFVITSGVAEIDEAIRRIVESHAPYPAFPPALARQFDVIEIRRSWTFDSAIRLQ